MCDTLDNTIVSNTRSVGNGKCRKRGRVCKVCRQHLNTIEIIIPKVSTGRPDEDSRKEFKQRLLEELYNTVEELLR